MKEQTTNRARRFTCRFTPDEYTKIEAKWKASTCRKLSDYVRHCLFNKPITTMIRNQSIDDLMTELSDLRTELNRIGNNFNQAVKRLHTLQSSDEFKQWQIVYESDKNALLQQVLDIKTQMQKIAEEWLQ